MKRIFLLQYFIVLISFLIDRSHAPRPRVTEQLDFGYHSYVDIISILNQFKKRFPDKVHLYDIGNSTQGRMLPVIAIADSYPMEHRVLRPEVKYIG